MKLYAETNFVLQLVLEQEEANYCRSLLTFGNDVHRVFIPHVALIEAQDTLKRKSTARRQLADSIDSHARELERSRVYREGRYMPVRQIRAELVRLSDHFSKSFVNVKVELEQYASFLTIDITAIDLALDLSARQLLNWFDALILASIVQDIASNRGASSCFVTTDSDFYRAASQLPELRDNGCVVMRRFRDAFGYLSHSS